MADVRIKLELDPRADAAYIELLDAPVVRTCRVNEQVLVDLDVNGVAVGIETLSISAPIPFAELETKFHVRSEVIATLRLIRPNPGAFFEFHSTSDGVSSASKLTTGAGALV